MPLDSKSIADWKWRATNDVAAGAAGDDWPPDVVLTLIAHIEQLDIEARAKSEVIEIAHREITNLAPTIRREVTAELADGLEKRLADLDSFKGGCACRHAEARAFLARLRRIAR